MQLRTLDWLLLLGALAACSSGSIVVSEGGFGGSSAGSAGPVGSTSGGSSGVNAQPRCPVDPPQESTSCAGYASTCAYGPDIREHCNEVYGCANGRWFHQNGTCVADCPKSFAAIAPGTACPDKEVACSYDEGTCGCVADEVPVPPPNDAGADGGDAGDGGSVYVPTPGVWKCVAPPTTVACPSARPRVLDACVKEVNCDYGSCELRRALSYSCISGFWLEPDPVDCP